MAIGLTNCLAKKLFLKTLEQSIGGYLEIVCPQETYRFGLPDNPLHAVLAVHDERFFRRAVLGGDIGMGEAYLDGDWSTPDLVPLVRFGVRNLDRMEAGNQALGIFSKTANFLSHRRNRNTHEGSKKNIAYHYDLGNDFYRLFLDPTLAYSCAYYENSDDSLETAQRRKFDVICRKLQLEPQDHVLEIGTGWGGFAAHAAEIYGCRVTTTTISRQQHDYAQELFLRLGPAAEKIDLLFDDYRNLRGKYDKIVSIEMFEAVGFEHYDDYFGGCDRLLKSDGSMLLQTITIQEARFDRYRKQSDWIKKHIFPGAELASVAEILRSLARTTRLQAFHLEDIGIHYALTLREWRRRYMQNSAEVRRLGFDERFLRMWEYYLSYCEGAFRERYISDVQLVLSKVTNRNQLMNEPRMESKWQECSQ
ncbi:MAG: cyclopropane-fatty-acyl-phospholipid synthase family protein [Acidobacteriota bacterium]|nr:cyclopropane-fatty-acyl-phospholipid synthase family protein [Acidobacteriota bacterium]